MLELEYMGTRKSIAAQAEAGEQGPEKDMGTNSNQFAGANNAGIGSPEKNS